MRPYFCSAFLVLFSTCFLAQVFESPAMAQDGTRHQVTQTKLLTLDRALDGKRDITQLFAPYSKVQVKVNLRGVVTSGQLETTGCTIYINGLQCNGRLQFEGAVGDLHYTCIANCPYGVSAYYDVDARGCSLELEQDKMRVYYSGN